ncbi:helix-turn-helix domain-containing protein [Kaistia defluvii]|uniref:AraC-like DNA-binding protein n=1 Tax=Kaistia defluvii TaxID=410841 RepID=A0ABV2QTC6_9HYPH
MASLKPRLRKDAYGRGAIGGTLWGEMPIHPQPALTSAMLSSRFDTFDLAPSAQFAAWRDHYRDVFDLDLADGRAGSYRAEHSAWALGGLTLTRASMPPGIVRQWRHWTRPRVDDWMLVVAPHAARRTDELDVPPLTFRSLARPFESRGKDGEVLSLFLPRHLFVGQAAIFDSLRPAVPCTGLTALMVDYLVSLEHRAPLLSGPELGRVAEATLAMVKACILPSAEHWAPAADTLNQATVARARRLIQQNLGVPSFGPGTLVRELGMSRSALYRAFQPHGGVLAVIKQERLIEAHRRLAAARKAPAVGEVALSLGFTDHSTFSRAFKQHFGYPPSDVIGLDLLRDAKGG